MKLELGDSATDGIRFLALGGGLLVAFRLLYLVAFHAFSPATEDPLQDAVHGFQNGYLLSDPFTLVVGGEGLTERLGKAVVLTALCGAFFSLLSTIAAMLFSRPAARAAILGVRAGIVLSGLWWVFVALALPPRTVVLSSAGFEKVQRPALLGDLSLPWPPERSAVPWSDVATIRTHSENGSCASCSPTYTVSAMVDTQAIMLVSDIKDRVGGTKEGASAAKRAAELALHLEASFLNAQ